MATVILGAVGQAYAGPVGAVIGAAIGSFIDRALAPRPHFETQSQRLSDLAVQNSSYGVAIPFCFGTMRMPGNVIWSTGLIERRVTETTSAGGKGGGGRVTNTNYTYSASFAIALCQRKIRRIGRIWADGKLVPYSFGRISSGGVLRVYTGDEDQAPDPVMEASIGVGNVPAHRGLAYVVFEDFALAEFASRIPNLNFEVIADEGSIFVSTLAQELAQIQDIKPFDTSGLNQFVNGYVSDGNASVRSVLESLTVFAPISVTERGRELILRDLPQEPIEIPFSDLGAFSEGEQVPRFERERIQDWELPGETLVHYLDPARDYQSNVQRARRLHVRRTNVHEEASAVAVPASVAKKAAERILNMTWTAREAIAMSLPLYWIMLESGDYIQIEETGLQWDFLINGRSLSGFRLPVSGNRYDPRDIIGDSVGDAGVVLSPVLSEQGISHLSLLDLPKLPGQIDDAPAFFAAANGDDEGWRSAAVFESLDGGISYHQRAVTDVPAIMGLVETLPMPSSVYLWDEISRIHVRLLNADSELSSRPALAVLNGANAALVGQEIIQFRNAVLMEDGCYALSGLLRGRLGTESGTVTHQINETFILLEQDALVNVAASLGQIGQQRLYKAVGSQDIFDDIVPILFNYEAKALRPLSPVHVRWKRYVNGDLNLSWIRRSRQGAEWIDGSDVPLGEAFERYDVEIMDGSGSVRRTVSTFDTSVLYSASQQNADFNGAIDTLNINIYQISDSVGRGTPAQSVISF